MKWCFLGAGIGLGAMLFILAAISAEHEFTDWADTMHDAPGDHRYP